MEKNVSSSTQTHVTPEEYLRLERASEDIRCEYFDGEMIPVPGISRYHNRINRDMVVDLVNQLEQGPCEVYFCEMRVKIVPTGSYAYPDIAVVCGEAQFEDPHVDTLLNPRLIIEILSDSTERHDRGRKLRHYRSIESLEEYVLVSQDEMRVERYLRQASGEWTYSDTTDPDAFLDLHSIGSRIPLARIYRSIQFRTEK